MRGIVDSARGSVYPRVNGLSLAQGAFLQIDHDLLHYIVSIPVQIFTAASVTSGLEAWSWIVDQRPALEYKIMTEIHVAVGWTMRRRIGLFSDTLQYARSRFSISTRS